MEDQILTPHFRLSEFTRSATAQAHGLDNSVPENLIPNLQNLCIQILEPLRQHVNVPIVITSGYRCPELNRLVGGVPNSQHLLGEAADIRLPDFKTGHEWFLWILDNCPFDQLIWEHSGKKAVGEPRRTWIHVSCLLDISKNRQHSFHLTKK